MTAFTARQSKEQKKATEYFLKMYNELDLEKYKLAKYQELFKLSSFQNMHDADLAYFDVYNKCSENAWTKDSLRQCLEREGVLLIKHPRCFNTDIYRKHVLKAINEIKLQLNNGALDYLYS